MLKIGDNGKHVVDISNPSCERVLGTLFKREDDCIYFRPNPLIEALTNSEWEGVGKILGELNR